MSLLCILSFTLFFRACGDDAMSKVFLHQQEGPNWDPQHLNNNKSGVSCACKSQAILELQD